MDVPYSQPNQDINNPSMVQGQVIAPFGPVVWKGNLNKDVINKTNQCIEKVKDDLNLDLVSQLAGRVEVQRSLHENIDPSVIDSIMNHVKVFAQDAGMQGIEKEDMYINGLWCNVQQKFEYNPLHSHDGMFSFVYYTKNTVTQEQAQSNKWDTTHESSTLGNRPLAGSIELHYGEPSFMNMCSFLHFPQEGDLLIFPAWLRHSVYPFYCEGERISVAGNVHMKNNGV